MRNFKILNIVMASTMFFIIQNLKAQAPSSDPAFQLVWADSFPNTNRDTINTNKWCQIFEEPPSDSVTLMWDSVSGRNKIRDIAYTKWYLNAATPPSMPNPSPPDTTNCQIINDTLNLYTQKVQTGYYNGNCWSWPHCTSTTNPPCNVSGTDGNCTVYATDTTCWHQQYRKFKFTSSILASKTMFRYGYFEIKFKLPAAPGSGHYVTGPTFWMFNANIDLVSGNKNTDIPWSEIDIFEMVAHNNDFTTSIHYAHYPDTATSTGEYYQAQNLGPITANIWHTAGCLWTSNEIVKYLDNVPVATLTTPGIKPDSLLPMPLILGVSNSPDAGDSLTDPNAAYPYKLKVKYVKVWQFKSLRCNTDTTLTSYNASTYKNALYHSITMNATTTVNNTNYQSFWGSDHITLNAGTTIDGTSNVLFDVTDCVSTMQNYKFVPQPPPASYLQRQSRHSYQ